MGIRPDPPVVAAYGARAQEYASLLGSVEATSPLDQELILRWARACGGPVVDLGCGPGHWTHLLHTHGSEVIGLDPAPEFIQHARRTFPGVRYAAGDTNSLPGESAGILAWYSLIHTAPAEVSGVLGQLVTGLRPGGQLLVGFFRGDRVEQFDHAIHPAWRWPMTMIKDALTAAGLVVVESQSRQDEGARPHGAVWARRP